mmetsp:Transcript_255/g.630  ORF Transcript_255/g.630 Transcript_255/m.630 type:complete len:314 (-) Transcript_255:104-1045(-)
MHCAKHLVDLLDARAATAAGRIAGIRHTARHAARHATRHAARGTAGTAAVELGHDRVDNLLELLLHVLVLVLLGRLVAVEPVHGLLALVNNGLLVVLGHEILDLVVLDRLLDLVRVRLEAVLCSDTLLDLGVLGGVLLGVCHHLVDVGLAQAGAVVLDGDLLELLGRLVLGRDVEDRVGVDVECDLNLRDATRRRRDVGEVELAELVAVLGLGPFALEDLDCHGRLVVRVRGEGLRLLGRDGGLPLDQRRHHTAGSLETERQRGNVDKEHLLELLVALLVTVWVEDGSLHGSTVRNGLVRIDRLGELLAAEVV